MLRKDVKLGFAIGGIMLAVVIVYVLVVPGDRKSVSVVTDDSQTKTDGGAPTVSTDGKTAEPDITSPSNAPPALPTGTDQGPTTAPSASLTPAAPSPANTTGGATDWNKLLAQGSSSPTMMSETPTPGADHASAPADAAPAASAAPSPDQVAAAAAVAAETNAAASAATPSDKTTLDLAIDTSSTPATQPGESAERTHIVQPGEMLTSIAAAAYGDSKKWKKIAEANPSVNPNRMAPGTKLVIPVLASYTQASSNSVSSAAAAASLDPQTQYQVEPNDSLYRISMKLYGKATHVDQLYQDNKDTIGSDPRRLKLNTVLKLTDPPTTSTTASR